MEALSKMFGSTAIIKLLRLFLFNPAIIYETKDIIKRAKVHPSTVRLELSMMERIGLIKKKSFFKETEKRRGKKKVIVKKRVRGWVLDETFELLDPLQKFFLDTAIIKPTDLVKKLRKAGRLKLVIISGVFIQDWDSRVDLLVVGDRLGRDKLNRAISDIEAELGVELKFAAFTTKDFKYRMDMRDKLVRDVLDFPHRKVLNSLNLM